MKVMEVKKADATPANKTMSVGKAVSDITEKSWMRMNAAAKKQATVSANDLVSLSALISYVADQSKQTEFSIARRLSDRFNIPNVTCLPADQYDNAIRYLVDGV